IQLERASRRQPTRRAPGRYDRVSTRLEPADDLGNLARRFLGARFVEAIRRSETEQDQPRKRQLAAPRIKRRFQPIARQLAAREQARKTAAQAPVAEAGRTPERPFVGEKRQHQRLWTVRAVQLIPTGELRQEKRDAHASALRRDLFEAAIED